MSDVYLITGGAGFIGSHLAEALLGAAAGVKLIDQRPGHTIETNRGTGIVLDLANKRPVLVDSVAEY